MTAGTKSKSNHKETLLAIDVSVVGEWSLQKAIYISLFEGAHSHRSSKVCLECIHRISVGAWVYVNIYMVCFGKHTNI